MAHEWRPRRPPVLPNSRQTTMYEHLATVERILDGDTIDFAVDVGFHLTMRMRVRLAGVGPPEPAGASKAFVEHAIPVGTQLLLRTYKLGKLGRFIADVVYVPELADPNVDALRSRGIQLADVLVKAGLARAAPREC